MSLHETIEEIEELLEEIKEKTYEDIKKDLTNETIIRLVREDTEKFVLAMINELGTPATEALITDMTSYYYKHGDHQ